MKVLVVDDHPIFRDGLVLLLQQMGPEIVILQSADAGQALTVVAEHADLDIVVLDLALPGMDGLRAITELGQARPDLPVVVLSSSEDPQDVRQALAHGALGYVPKSAARHTLLSAIRVVLGGDLYIPPFVLVETLAPQLPTPRAGLDSRRPTLTDRQIEVLRLLTNGLPNKAIALQLGLSEKTVKAHVTAIFKALHVVSRTQAAAVGRETGIV